MLSVLCVAALLAVSPAARPVEGRTVRIAVSPAAAPKPAFKYRLLPEVREMNPGNPVQWYVRCFAEQRNFFFQRESVAARARYRAMPLSELRALKFGTYGGSALVQADWGARLDSPDWGVLQRVQTEGTELTLPELDPLWVLATALQVRFRIEIADGRFDEAIRTAKTMFALARHLGEFPTSSANRLGIAIADLTLDTLCEMMQQPGCPNLYWAFADLPVPLVDLHRGIQGDAALAAAEFRGLRADDAMSELELDEFIGRLSGRTAFLREQTGLPPRGLRTQLAQWLKEPGRAGAARSRLLNDSPAESWKQRIVALRVLAFPDAQVVLLDELRKFEERRDDDAKVLGLPAWQIDFGRERDTGLYADLLPPVLDARLAQARLEQRFALLRHVEALRMHAAGHGGKLPATLRESQVPLPVDPFTNAPVESEVNGGTAHLRGAAPKGVSNPTILREYEVVIRK